MEYILAKKLKDAGFPQNFDDNGSWGYCTKDKCCGNELHLIHNDNDEGGVVGNNYSHGSWRVLPEGRFIKAPTLSELIEACGLGIFQLTKDADGYWRANGKGGYSAKEAVANLWLELNK